VSINKVIAATST